MRARSNRALQAWAWAAGLCLLICLAGVPQAGRGQASSAPSSAPQVSDQPGAVPMGSRRLSLPAQAPVVDQAGVLNADETTDLRQALRSLDAAYGVRAGVVVVSTAKPDGIEALANALGNEWHIGSRDGLLIVVAVQDHSARIEVSRGLEGLIPDLYAHKVLRESMSPAFAQGRYFEGLRAGLARLDKRLSGAEPGELKPPVSAQSMQTSRNELQGFIVAQVLLICFAVFSALIGWLLDRMRRWWSAPYALAVGGCEFALASIYLSAPGAAAAGVVCGVLTGVLVWRPAARLEARLRKAGPPSAARSLATLSAAERKLPMSPALKAAQGSDDVPQWKTKSTRNNRRIARRKRAAAAGAGTSGSVWADSSSFGSSSSSSSSDSSSSASSDSSSDDFAGGGASDKW